jgi:G3E family GTPase
MKSASMVPGWAHELQGNGHKPETEEYGISSFVYRANRPFHPSRIHELLSSLPFPELFPGVLRSKGFAWSAGNYDNAVAWSSAGLSAELRPGPRWLATQLPKDEWPEEAEKFKKSRHGDRRIEIVFIGVKLNKEDIWRKLDAVLLTEEEFLTDFGAHEETDWSRDGKAEDGKEAAEKKGV